MYLIMMHPLHYQSRRYGNFDSLTGEMLASRMLLLTTDNAQFEFDHIQLSDGAHPVVSVLRNFFSTRQD